MDSGTVIVGAVLIALCILPIMIIEFLRKRKEKKLLGFLSSLAGAQNCKVTKFEHCCKQIIGIDEKNNYLFFINSSGKEFVNISVDLKEIQNCKVYMQISSPDSEGVTLQVIDKIGLAFRSKIKSQPDIVIEVFNSDGGTQVSGELQFAEKWEGIIRDKLKN